MSAPTVNFTTADYAFKNYYSPERLRMLAHKGEQFYLRVRRNENFRGGPLQFAVKYGRGAGISATYSKAYGNASHDPGVQFTMNQKALWAVGKVSNQEIQNTRGNAEAFVDLLQEKFDHAIEGLGWTMSGQLFRKSSGELATCSGISSGVVTVTDKADLYNIEVGMKVVTAANAASALDSATADEVLAVDRNAGTFTVASSPNGTYTSTQLVFREGDYDSANDENVLTGLADWIPTTAPTGADIGGVDRSTDVTRLAGHRVDGSTGALEDHLIDISAEIRNEGGLATAIYMSPRRFASFSKDLMGRLEFCRKEYGDASSGIIGFNNATVMFSGSEMEVIVSPACPDSNVYVLDESSWVLASAGPAPHIDDEGGTALKLDPSTTSAGYYVRGEAFAELCCHAPGYNGVIHSLSL